MSVSLQYNEYNDVVVEHRVLKEKQQLKAEQEERENKAAVKVCLSDQLWGVLLLTSLQVQAWWKGMMVRKQLGPYAKKKGKKKGKGKKGKGKKGKKGKKKGKWYFTDCWENAVLCLWWTITKYSHMKDISLK